MTPLAHYQAEVARGAIHEDPVQLQVVSRLDRLYQELQIAQVARRGWLTRCRVALGWVPPSPRGLYLWGGVGRGKTYLVDSFHDGLDFPEKRRMHFHRFMQQIHGELKTLPKTPDPLPIVAARWAEQVHLLCFDEFHVGDIGDAMLLAGLLKELFARGVVLVATSNTPPERLYEHGLQRSRFLPAIDLIQRHTEVVPVNGPVDYRLRVLEQAPIYHYPLGEQVHGALVDFFQLMAPGSTSCGERLLIHDRWIQTVQLADGLAWLTFAELCATPRAPMDYIEIARTFATVVISDIPLLGEQVDDQALRFIHLVDELYDRGVKLVCSAAAPPDQLYQGGRLGESFQRTVSRLEEMRSRAYLERPHRP